MSDKIPQDVKCPICESVAISIDGLPEFSPAARKLSNQDYIVVKCLDCRFYFVWPGISFSPEQWRGLYGDGYFGELTSWWVKKRERDRQQRLDWLERYSTTPIHNFLDIGCGEGYILLDAIKRDWHASGIDIVDNRIEAAKDSRIAFRQGDILEAAFPHNYFDAIYLDSVLEHLLNPLDYLREMNRILKPGGAVYIGVPNEDCLFNEFKKLVLKLSGRSTISAHIKPFKAPYHVIGFGAQSLKIALGKCGFEIAKIRNFAGEFEWRKFKAFSRPFLMHLALLPVHLAAIPLQKRIYIDTIVLKK